MNEDTLKGAGDKINGKIKEVAGNATGNDQLAAEGQAQQVKGGVREAVGKVKDAVSDAADYVSGR